MLPKFKVKQSNPRTRTQEYLWRLLRVLSAWTIAKSATKGLFLFLQRRPDELYFPHSLLFNGYRVRFPASRSADHWYPYTTEVNKWNSNSTACARNLPLYSVLSVSFCGSTTLTTQLFRAQKFHHATIQNKFLAVIKKAVQRRQECINFPKIFTIPAAAIKRHSVTPHSCTPAYYAGLHLIQPAWENNPDADSNQIPLENTSSMARYYNLRGDKRHETAYLLQTLRATQIFLSNTT